jgi:hypothetical protein
MCHTLTNSLFPDLQEYIINHDSANKNNIKILNAVSSRLHETRSMGAPLTEEIALNIRKNTSILHKYVETYANFRQTLQSQPKSDSTQNQKIDFNNYVSTWNFSLFCVISCIRLQVSSVNSKIENLKVHSLKIQSVNNALVQLRDSQTAANADDDLDTSANADLD